MHTLTRESQEAMYMFTSISGVGFTDDDEDVETLMVDADIPFSGQLNITTSSLPDNAPAYPVVSVKSKRTVARALVDDLLCNVSS